MTVLAIDSASRGTAWVILVGPDGTVLARRDLPGGELDHLLPPALAEVVDEGLAAIVTLTGPGSYSGVRTGMAAGLGFAAARGLPLHGLGNLTAAAAAAEVSDEVEFTVVSDAGRGGVYRARFSVRERSLHQVSLVERIEPEAIDTIGRVFATTEIPGIAAELLDPVRVLAAAVPRALELPPLAALGLAAIHAEAAADR